MSVAHEREILTTLLDDVAKPHEPPTPAQQQPELLLSRAKHLQALADQVRHQPHSFAATGLLGRSADS